MYPHRIRLRGPWECEPLTRSNAGALSPPFPVFPPGRLADLGLPGFAGQVCFRRRFGYPGRIDAYERVWLVFDGMSDPITISVNDRKIGVPDRENDGYAVEVTPLLQTRNELLVEIDAANDRTVLGSTGLEVRCAAYLRGMRLTMEESNGQTQLHVRGEVVGECEEALELYVIVDRHNVAYERVSPTPAGHPFHLTTESGAGEWVKVELVRGAMAWYRWDAPFPGSHELP